MVLEKNTCLLVFLICSLSLLCKSASAGSSFLSPSQKPQNRGKSSRVGRRAMEELSQPAEGSYITIGVPFEMGFTVKEEEFEDYGEVLQGLLQGLLGNTKTPERPAQP